MLPKELIQRLARELSVDARQAEAALALFEEGATIPFIARYRKEVTGGLDELQLRDIRDRADYLQELEARRAAILSSIEEQGKLDDALRAKILAAETKQALEDLYLPYKPKRRTRATIAKERGLEPLADLIWTRRDPQSPDAVRLPTDEEVVAAAAPTSVLKRRLQRSKMRCAVRATSLRSV